MEFSPKKEEKKYKIKCISCLQEVEVFFQFGPSKAGFYTSVCPLCNKLAYNSKIEPNPV